MRVIKLAIISIVVLFGLISVVGMFFSPYVNVVRQVEINAPGDSVYNKIADLVQWQSWMIDSTRNVQVLSAQTKGKGAKMKIGTNEVTITGTSDSSVSSVWKSERGVIRNSEIILLPDNNPNFTKVQWSFQQTLKWYPWERIGAVMSEKILGPALDSSLANLKRTMEKE